MVYKPSQKLKARLTRNTLVWAFTGLLVFSASVLATSGLAWFTVSDTNRVQNLVVSYGGEAFRITRIKGPNSMLIEPQEIDGENIEIPGIIKTGAVSSMYTKEWWDEGDAAKMSNLQFAYNRLQNGADTSSFLPVLRTTYGPYVEETTKTKAASGDKGDYLSFIFDFYNNQDTFVYLADTTFVTPDVEANEEIVRDYQGNLINTDLSVENLNNAAEAVRISFLSNMGYKIFEPNPEEDEETIFAGKLDVRPWDGYYDLDEETHKEILFGEYDEEAKRRLDTAYRLVNEDRAPKKSANSFLAEHSKGSYAFTDEDVASLDAAGLLAHEKTYKLNELGVNYEGKKNPIVFIKANTTERVVVSIYCEGWDKQCTNAAYLAAIKMRIAFSARYAPYGYDGRPLFAHPTSGGDN